MADNPRGWDHQQIRARLLPFAYNQPCPRCLQPMLKGQDLDLGHSVDVADGNTGPGDRIEHASCNRGDGAAKQLLRSKLNPSREW